jgi:hypothetical protein
MADPVYTDLSGTGYDPAALNTAWNDPTFSSDPANARVPGILQSYGYGSPSAPGPAPSAPSAPAAPAYSPPPITVDSGTTQYNQGLRDFMTSQLGQLSTPVDPTSPDIAPALSAYDTQSQRDQQTQRDALAERYYASGEGGTPLQSGGFDTAVQGLGEAAAANRQNFAGSTVYNAAQSRRQQLQSMLQTAVGAGQTDAAQQIQSQIANIDAQLREQGLTQQNAQFNDQLSYNYANMMAGLNRDSLLAGLTGA